MASRLEKILPTLISNEQSAFVGGRNIGEPIRLITDILYQTRTRNIPGLLFAADFQAAFDSIDFSLLFQVLVKYGFSDSFIRWIRILHIHSKSSVMNGGFSTGYFNLERGTKQGDPLAPYIFILVMEVLISMVHNNSNIKGINIDGKEIKQCIFADDTTYFLRDLESLTALMETLSEFSKISSLSVNYDKSEIAWIGSEKESDKPVLGMKNINLTTDTIRILGIYFTYNQKLLIEQNFDRVLNNFRTVLNIWKGRTLSIYGKTIILKTLAIPKVLYVSGLAVIPTNFGKEIKDAMLKFLWHGKKPKN